ncbi:alpha/beta hydrolase family protein [Brevundimonas sp.]|uniref:alpha/beta hydrolase family protein n=1 Tax=Brevundimonas sp. TaxID=1871086 RepID=UPI002FC7EF46
MLAVPAMAKAQDRHAYGPHARQTLRLVEGRGTGPKPVVVLLGDKGQDAASLMRNSRELTRRGISVAITDRREGRHGFAAHTADVARVIGYLKTHSEALELDGRIALWGIGTGADAALLTVADRRYLAVVAMQPRDISGLALSGAGEELDATFTHPRAYGGDRVPAVYRGGRGDSASAIAFLSGLL